MLVHIKWTIVHFLRQCCAQALATLAFLDEGGLGTNKWRDRMVGELKVVDLILARCKIPR